MTILLGGKPIGEHTTSRESLQKAWDRGEAQLAVLLTLGLKLEKQKAWLDRNGDHEDWIAHKRTYQENVDKWWGDELERFYRRCGAFGQIAKKAEVEDLRAVHPYAVHEGSGLHQLRIEREKELGIGQHIPSVEAPF